jgi:hypothetical protein
MKEPAESERELKLDAAIRSFVAAKIDAGYSKEEAFKILRVAMARYVRKTFKIVD